MTALQMTILTPFTILARVFRGELGTNTPEKKCVLVASAGACRIKYLIINL